MAFHRLYAGLLPIVLRRCCSPVMIAAAMMFVAAAGPARSEANIFDQELRKVSPTAQFERILNRGYGAQEWSVDGLTLNGGSESALDSASSEALYAMGFRFYTPQLAQYPAELKPARIEKRSFKIPHISIFLSYGHDRRTEIGKKLQVAFERWRQLNAVADKQWPAGHIWPGVIAANKALYEKNPQLLRDERTFELDDPDAYRRNVALSAAFLAERLNPAGRHAFDPTDGDRYPSETIYRFALDVVNQVRKTVPNAQLGVYAYAGHRLPVDFKLPGIYIQVALGFNRTGLSYQDLVERHASVADVIMLREYFDVEAWFKSLPVGNRRNQRDYYDVNYPPFFKSGVSVVNGEFNENWLANIVSTAYAIRYLKDGEADYKAILSEIVDQVFAGDPAVAELYLLWSRPGSKFDETVLRTSFEIVARMRGGWHAQAFRDYLVIALKIYRLGAKSQAGYVERLADLMSNVHAVTDRGWIHSYALQRRLANGNVKKDLPELWMFRKPAPDWMKDAKPPRRGEFEAALKRLSGGRVD